MPKVQELVNPRNFRYNVLSLPDEFVQYVIIVWHPIIDVNGNQVFYYHTPIYTKRKGCPKAPPSRYFYFILIIT
tara:strand:- start:409 stop:630 length:222 start_codon:yes stop_codon:yes gene_type:complete